MWALTGAYLVFPKPFDKLIDRVPSAPILTNVGILHAVHVGDFGGWPVKALWVVLGIAPPILFVTGCIMWWYRVLSPWRKRAFLRRPRVRELSLNVPARALRAPGRLWRSSSSDAIIPQYRRGFPFTQKCLGCY